MVSEGSILSGRYRLVSRLGRGGMGAVWRAEHLGLSSHVAIKLIDEEIVKSEEMLARFKREAQAAASLRMTNVVQILDYGVDGQTPYIAMELLEGETLSTRLERQSALVPEEAASILSQVGRALARAHEHGIVHRDLKPDNIFLVQDGDQEIAKVLDFGVAKTSGTERALHNTSTGALLGTPYYMSPEQATARGDVDSLTDVWALGVVAFESLVGRRPFDGPSIGAIVVSICSEPLPIPSDFGLVPEGFDEWFATACHRDRHSRFRTAVAATAALRRVCGADFGRSSISSYPPISLRDSVSGATPSVVRTVLGHTSAPAPTMVGGTPDPTVLSLPSEPRGFRRKAWSLVAGAVALGVALLTLLLGSSDTSSEGQPSQTLVTSSPDSTPSSEAVGSSPTLEVEALTLDDLALESDPERKSRERTRKKSTKGKTPTAGTWPHDAASQPRAPQQWGGPPSQSSPAPGPNAPPGSVPDRASPPPRGAPDVEDRLAF